ncbi:putative phloem protein [Helianthus debilis subsp. tardiflorus]
MRVREMRLRSSLMRRYRTLMLRFIFRIRLRLVKLMRYLVQLMNLVFDDDHDDKFGSNFWEKDIYARLSRANSIDGDTKKVWLHKGKGKPCVFISFNGLTITGIDDRRYWSRIPTEESRRFRRRVYNCHRIHGWDRKPVRFQLTTSNGQEAVSECNLTSPGMWNLYHVGNFVVEDSKVPMKVKLSMMQIDCTHTKGGLCVDSVQGTTEMGIYCIMDYHQYIYPTSGGPRNYFLGLRMRVSIKISRGVIGVLI